jgi:PBP1b-binding outer membrane lipoprotein LpoB
MKGILFVILLSVILAGCATPATSVLMLDYNKPIRISQADKTEVDKAETDKAETVKSILDKYTLPNAYIAKDIVNAADVMILHAPPGTGSSRPEVKPVDAWSIVLSKVHIEKAKSWASAPNIAVLLRVNSGDNSDIDGKWILAAAATEVPTPSDLNFDNILVWSGITNKTITIDLQLLELNKADKEKLSGYLSVASLATNAIPAYGQIASAIIQAGDAINNSRGDYTVLLTYTLGFHPEHALKYAAYALMPQEIARQNSENLWYNVNKLSPAFDDQVMVSNDTLNSNWCAFRIIKGSSRTFEVGREKSLADVRKLADTWVNSVNPSTSFDSLKGAMSKVVSSVEAQRLISKTSFDDQGSLLKTLTAVKSKQSGDPNLKLNDDDYSKLLQVISSYLPAELIPQDDNIDSYITSINKLNDYTYNNNIDQWVRK